jgi:hypothetical protein
MKRSGLVLLVVGVLLLCATGPAHAAAILLTDGRAISVEAMVSAGRDEGELETDTDSAASSPAPFDPWAHGVSASASLPEGTSGAVASQTSAITASLFTSEMSSDVTTNALGGSATAFATSTFLIGFELTTPHSFILTGQAQAGFPPLGSRQAADVFVSFGSHNFPTSDPLNATGVLEPGVYQFRAGTFAAQVEDFSPGPTFLFADLVFEFALTELAQVREPSAWLLLAAAVTGALLGFGRRRGANKHRAG